MSFLFPNLLFFLFALSIPIIIHLFNFRRYRKIEFTNVKLLRDIEISTKSTKNLKNLLLLISRLLAMTFLIFAFAQPFIPVDEDSNVESGSALILFIDNSFSMDEGSEGNKLLDAVKESSSNLVESYGSGRQYYLITNEFAQSDLDVLSKGEVLDEIVRLEIGIFSKTFSEITNRIKAIQLSSKLSAGDVYLFSDFQKSQFETLHQIDDSSFNFNIVLIESEKSSNISIDSCWISNPVLTVDGIDSFQVSISNYSDDELINHPIRLFINDKQTSLKSVDIEPWSSIELTIPNDNADFGFFSCRLETVDEGINQDDFLYFSYKIDSSINIYQIGTDNTSRFFEALYSKSFFYRQDNERNTDISLLNKSGVFIVDGKAELSPGLISEIQQNVLNGANLILYPVSANEEENINHILQSFNLELIASYDSTDYLISKLNIHSSILKNTIEKLPKNAIYPNANGHYKLSEKVHISKEDILSLENGAPALRRYSFGKGSVYLFCFGLSEEESNFTHHPLFVPIAINLAYTSRKTGLLYNYIGKGELIEYQDNQKQKDVAVHIKNGEIDIIPEIKRISNKSYLQLHQQIKVADNYELVSNNERLDVISLNYTRKESDIRRYDESELQELINSNLKNQVKIISGKSNGIASKTYGSNKAQALWKYCIIFALMFFVAEVLILKLMST